MTKKYIIKSMYETTWYLTLSFSLERERDEGESELQGKGRDEV